MGCGISHYDPELSSHLLLAKAHMNYKSSLKFTLNELRIKSSYSNYNCPRESKEIGVAKKTISKNLFDYKNSLLSLGSLSSKVMENQRPIAFTSQKVSISNHSQDFLEEDIQKQSTKSEILKSKLQSLKGKLISKQKQYKINAAKLKELQSQSNHEEIEEIQLKPSKISATDLDPVKHKPNLLSISTQHSLADRSDILVRNLDIQPPAKLAASSARYRKPAGDKMIDVNSTEKIPENLVFLMSRLVLKQELQKYVEIATMDDCEKIEQTRVKIEDLELEIQNSLEFDEKVLIECRKKEENIKKKIHVAKNEIIGLNYKSRTKIVNFKGKPEIHDKTRLITAKSTSIRLSSLNNS